MSSKAPKFLDDVLLRCRNAGLRRTRALEAVLQSLVSSNKPLTLAHVAESPELKNSCDKATVYRLLTRLEHHGIIRRLGLHDRSAYYSMIFPGHHDDYLICTECGVIEKLDLACPVEKLEAQISRESGFRKLYHELEFFGVCPACG
ncbi:MAG: transcriptional repressor [Verrucomicrobia bacterium]|nr:transcriptional repressor [Verrucomicrobiota bacterium]